VAQVYLDVLHRFADADGLRGWTNALVSGASRSQVVLGITTSTEYRTLVVEDLYAHYLGRSADPLGLSSDLQALASGGPRTRSRRASSAPTSISTCVGEALSMGSSPPSTRMCWPVQHLGREPGVDSGRARRRLQVLTRSGSLPDRTRRPCLPPACGSGLASLFIAARKGISSWCRATSSSTCTGPRTL